MAKAKLPWKPWHEVVALREDLKSDELPMHMVAADLYEVLTQSDKRPIYEDPEKFFAFHLSDLPTSVSSCGTSPFGSRGKNDKAVRQLELTCGGGKTHTLITLLHLMTDPDHLLRLATVEEFSQAIGQTPPKARVAGLCFDKLDVEKGMEVRGPDGQVRQLKQPWSVLTYQLGGDEGLQILQCAAQSGR